MSAINFDQPSAGNVNSNQDALSVKNTGSGSAVVGESTGFDGMRGSSHSDAHAGLSGVNESNGFGVWASSQGGEGVHGESKSGRVGVSGVNHSGGLGVFGSSTGGVGIRGESFGGGHAGGTGVNGVSVGGIGVWGQDMAKGVGVKGDSNSGAGVMGESKGSDGVLGISHSNGNAGVSGVNDSGGSPGYGVWGSSQGGEGVHGESTASNWAAVAAINKGGGPGLWAAGTPAAHFEGNVEVTGDVVLAGQDVAEDFFVPRAQQIVRGTVMVINDEDALQVSNQAYDRRVAGVVSGAGNLRPALILGSEKSGDNRLPIALMGKVFCKVDARYARIEVGDLLTTSPTPGHAMKAKDPVKAFGSVIGKALRPLREGQGMIPILIALQ